jgi:hypothetical protein
MLAARRGCRTNPARCRDRQWRLASRRRGHGSQPFSGALRSAPPGPLDNTTTNARRRGFVRQPRREPGVRQRAIGSRLAPASVGRQQRRRRDQVPCVEQRPRPCLTIGCGASRSRGHPRLRSAWCRPASRSQRMRSRRKLCSQANEDRTSARGRVPSRGRCSGGRSPVSRLGATARDGTCRGHGRDRRSQSENGDLVAERWGQPTCGAAPPAMRIAMATDEKADDPRHLP